MKEGPVLLRVISFEKRKVLFVKEACYPLFGMCKIDVLLKNFRVSTLKGSNK